MNCFEKFALLILFVINCCGETKQCKSVYVQQENKNATCMETNIVIPSQRGMEDQTKFSIHFSDLTIPQVQVIFLREESGNLIFQVQPSCQSYNIFRIYLNYNILCEQYDDVNLNDPVSGIKVVFNYKEMLGNQFRMAGTNEERIDLVQQNLQTNYQTPTNVQSYYNRIIKKSQRGRRQY